jgi:cytochrome c-type biogenesis protein CcmH/NrfF
MRQRIKAMQDQGRNDKDIIDMIVQQEGIVALAAPPGEGWGLFTWIMPGAALVGGFFLYSWWVRRNRAQAEATPNEVDRDVLNRFRDQIDAELGSEEDLKDGQRQKK